MNYRQFRPRPFRLVAMPFGDKLRMSEEVLEEYIRQLLAVNESQETTITWEGGEPTRMGIAFFRRSMQYVEKYRKPGQTITHTIKTNGVLLNEDWCAFFKHNNFLVALAADGPRAMHDAWLVPRSEAATFDQVMRAWDSLRTQDVAVSILCTIHATNADHPLEVYHFFRDELEASRMQFVPLVERTSSEFVSLATLGWDDQAGADDPIYARRLGLVTERSIRAEQFGRFLIAIFDEWVAKDMEKVFVQTFDVALSSWMGQSDLCIFCPTCGNDLALEPEGDLYSCEHYIGRNDRLGNILDTPMVQMVASEKQRAFGQHKLNSLPHYCRECDVLFACYGECPRNRFISTPTGEPGLNYLCAGYKLFFHHIDSAMKLMVGLLKEGGQANEATQWHSGGPFKQ